MTWSRERAITAAVAFGGLVVLAAFVVSARSGHAKNATPETPEIFEMSALKRCRAKGTSIARTPSDVDLLDLIDTAKDVVAGEWGFQERALVTSATKWARLQIPCVPPEEYDLSLTVTRKRGSDSLNLGILLAGRQTMVAIDGNDGAESWLFLHPEDKSLNESKYSGKALRYQQSESIVCSVRKEGVTVTVDGRVIIDWKGNAGDAYLLPAYQVPNPKALILGCHESTFAIAEMVLRPITGTCQILR